MNLVDSLNHSIHFSQKLKIKEHTIPNIGVFLIKQKSNGDTIEISWIYDTDWIFTQFQMFQISKTCKGLMWDFVQFILGHIQSLHIPGTKQNQDYENHPIITQFFLAIIWSTVIAKGISFQITNAVIYSKAYELLVCSLINYLIRTEHIKQTKEQNVKCIKEVPKTS